MEYAGGVHLSGTSLWFDAVEPADLSFLSSASTAAVPAHRRVLATERTAKLLAAQIRRGAALICPYRRPFALGDMEIELFPAGRLPGSAQLRVRTSRGDVVYAGSVRLEGSPLAERAQVVPCDVLILDTSGVDTGASLPPRAVAEQRLLAYVRRSFTAGLIPVIYANELGEAQEVLRALGDHGITTRAHRAVYQWCRAYRELGLEMPGVKRFQGTPGKDEAVVFPARLQGSRAVTALRRVKTALVGGGAAERGARHRLHVNEAIPWSIDPDLAGLVEYVDAARPLHVYLGGAHAERVAEALKARGFAVTALLPPAQMPLL